MKNAPADPTLAILDDAKTWPIAIPPALVASGELRLGHRASFFLPGVFADHVDAVGALFDLWLTTVPEGAIASAIVGASSSTPTPFSAKVVDRCRAQLTAKVAAKYAAFSIEGPLHRFEANGQAMSPERVKLGNASFVEVAFPWNTPTEDLLAFARKGAELLALGSAFVTPSLFFDGDLSGNPASTPAARIALANHGIDFRASGWALGSKCHGAHWVTILGPKLVKALSATGAAIPGVDVERIGGSLLFQTSPHPEVTGDLEGLRSLAHELAPITAPKRAFPRQAAARTSIELCDGSGPDFEAFEKAVGSAWSDRHVDPKALAPYLARLEVLRACELDPRANLGRIADAPYLSTALRRALVALAQAALRENDESLLERVLAIFPPDAMMTFASVYDLLPEIARAPDAHEFFGWWVARTSHALTSEQLGDFCGEVIELAPHLAGPILEALPPDFDDWSFLYIVNNELGALYERDLDDAEKLSDAIQPFAHHNAPMYLWTATIYIAKGRVDDAMTQIELAFEHGWTDFERIESDKDFAPLFGMARFKALAAKKQKKQKASATKTTTTLKKAPKKKALPKAPKKTRAAKTPKKVTPKKTAPKKVTPRKR